MRIHRWAPIASLCCLAAVASTASAAVQSTSWGTAAPPATIGGYSMQAFGLDPRGVPGGVTGIGVAEGSPFGTVTFSILLTHYRVGNGWATWSNGYAGDVYASINDSSVTLLPSPGTKAFSLYVEPNAFGLHSCVVTCGDASVSGPVQGNSGALGIGFYTTDGTALPAITVSFDSSAQGFAIGQFAAAIPDSDGDGVPDASDNCPNVTNQDQANCDGDSLGDACETDPDANLNGIRDNCETGPLVFAVPQNFATIGSAITAATAGSIVRVGPGNYPERINFSGKAITVESTAGAATTILDGGGLPTSIVSFLAGEGPESVLRGFTVRNGQGGQQLPQAQQPYVVGGGIHINLSSPTIEDCIIEDCSAPFGGGVVLYRSSATIRRCTFRDNLGSLGGGGLLIFRGYGALVDDCLFEDNRAAEGGGILAAYGSSTVRRCDFLGNESAAEGSAIHYRYIAPEPTEPPSMLVQDCVIRENSSDILGAAVFSLPDPPVPTLSVQGTEICDNIARAIVGLHVDLGGNLICECPADADLNGIVNANDLALVLGFWGPCPAPCGADIDRDGAVDANDLALVLGAWGACP